MAIHLRTELVLEALNMALDQRRPGAVIHHSDQGSQYTSLAFGKRCEEAGVRPSMGSVGDCFDNAMCESFFATLECELLDRRHFKTQIKARMAVFEFIEEWYNPHRRHSAIGYLHLLTTRRPVVKTLITAAPHRPLKRGNSRLSGLGAAQCLYESAPAEHSSCSTWAKCAGGASMALLCYRWFGAGVKFVDGVGEHRPKNFSHSSKCLSISTTNRGSTLDLIKLGHVWAVCRQNRRRKSGAENVGTTSIIRTAGRPNKPSRSLLINTRESRDSMIGQRLRLIPSGSQGAYT
jgi:hypothetical protein